MYFRKVIAQSMALFLMVILGLCGCGLDGTVPPEEWSQPSELPKNDSITEEVEGAGIVSADPSYPFWMSIRADTPVNQRDQEIVLELAFGANRDEPKLFEIHVRTTDFQATYAEQFHIDGVVHTAEEVHVQKRPVNDHEDLPKRMKITLKCVSEDDPLRGTLTVSINQSSEGSEARLQQEVYYYGDTAVICFSTDSQEAAQALHDASK